MKHGLIITIDGPAGTGKSTVARLLANKLGFSYLDTGALYRVITYQALKKSVSPKDRQSLKRLLKSLRIQFKDNRDQQKVFLNGRDVTKLIREPHITENVFHYAELPLVRQAMLKIQRKLGANGNIVAEGRDLGSVVFPRADIKFYLDASASERARRRWKELKNKGIKMRCQNVLSEIKSRDKRDRNRAIAPLMKVRDAVRIDTTNLSIKEVVQKLSEIVIKHNKK